MDKPFEFEPPERTLLPDEYAKMLASYRVAEWKHSMWQLSTTLFGLVASWVLCFFSLSVSYWLTLLCAIPAALFLIRIFILQHDCGHGSFFKSRKANNYLGSILGVITFTPYQCWRKQHAIHHATSGDLDRRGHGGEIDIMTVKEYQEASPRRRFLYRLYRNPFVLFAIGPFYQFVIHQRFTFVLPKEWKRERWSVFWTNIGGAALVAATCWLIGWREFLMIQIPVVTIASSVGVWLFYVQHQFEDAFWDHADDWDYFEAAVYGSTYYQLPKVLQWFTANIGLHHIHHLDSRIPNYRLQKVFDENPVLQKVNRLTFWESLSCVSFKLWDEEKRKMVGFREAAVAN